MHSAELVTTPLALERLAARLAVEPLLACDLEADSLHHYQEKVCLLQFSTPSAAALVDPLQLRDLSALAPIMANPAIRKIFHGADYDIRSLHRDFGIEVVNLFDTMIACQYLGETEVGLAAMLRKRFGMELDKKYQKADWSRRPLLPEMMDYAVKDTALLIELYQQLSSELREAGRLAWVEEECANLCRVRVGERPDGPLCLRFKGAGRLEPRTLGVLEALLQFRECRARDADRPPFKVLEGELLRELALARPSSMEELAEVAGVKPWLLERYGQGLLGAIAKGMALPTEQLPVVPKQQRLVRSKGVEMRLRMFKEWRDTTAHKLGIEAGLLCNNSLLEHLVTDLMTAKKDVVAAAMKKWQWQLFGEEIWKLIQQGRSASG